MYCSNCGKQIPDEVKFCPNCGKSVGVRKEKQARGNVMLYVSAIALCLILGLGGYWLHTEIKYYQKEAQKNSGKVKSLGERTLKRVRSLQRPVDGVIDVNYKLPDPNSSQSE